jgi:predicted small lipoprotein YifL
MKNLTPMAVLCIALSFLAACEQQKGPMERAGEKADDAAKSVKEDADKAADKIKDAANDVGSGAKKAVDDIKK